MVIANFQVKNTLRAYGEQLADRSRFSRAKAPKTALPRDEVNLSPESKKKLMADRIAQEMVTQFNKGPELNETGREILQRLRREYGDSLTPDWKQGEGLVFRVDQGKTPKGGKFLPPAETDRLKDSLFDIARSIVYSNWGNGGKE
jgi:hypothetical protein